MLPPKIAIIGSADPTRNITRENASPDFPYEPPVETELARQMANMISGEIAKRGWRLLVYDSDNKFIEGEAVSGFVRATKGTPGSIVVRQPQTREPKLFRKKRISLNYSSVEWTRAIRGRSRSIGRLRTMPTEDPVLLSAWCSSGAMESGHS